MDRKKRWGKRLLFAGMAMLLLGLVLAFLTNWALIPLLLSGSIFVNTAGVTLLRHGKQGGSKHD